MTHTQTGLDIGTDKKISTGLMPFYNANHYQSTVFKQEKDYARQLAVSIGHLNTEHSTNAFHVVNALIQ